MFTQVLGDRNCFHSLHYEYLLGVTTILEVVQTTCKALWTCLQPVFMAAKNEDWLIIADEFNHRTNFPKCVGAIESKHIHMCTPAW
jgi:hypothetical protein